MSQAGQEATSTDIPIKTIPENISETGYKCVCLNTKSIVKKKNELNIIVMFIRDRMEKRGGGVILYATESIQAYEIKIEGDAVCNEAVWFKIVSGNSKLTVGLVYRSPNINVADNTKIQNATKGKVKGNVS